MKIIKAAQVQEEQNGSLINFIRGRIKRAFPPTQGTGKFGPWTVTNVILTDETGDVRIGVFDIKMDDLVGKTVAFSTTSGSKGISVVEGKNGKELKVNKSVKVDIGDEAERLSPDSSQPAAVAVRSSVSAMPQAPLDPKHRIKQNALLMGDCIRSASDLASSLSEEGIQVKPDHFQAISSSLFIAAERAGLASLYTIEAKPEPKPNLDSDELGW